VLRIPRPAITGAIRVFGISGRGVAGELQAERTAADALRSAVAASSR